MFNEDDNDSDDDTISTPKRVAIAKLLAASLIEQEATLLSAASFEFENPADELLAAHVIVRVKMHLKQIAGKLREQN